MEFYAQELSIKQLDNKIAIFLGILNNILDLFQSQSLVSLELVELRVEEFLRND